MNHHQQPTACIAAKFTVAGFHHLPDAIGEHRYQRTRHRHQFQIEVEFRIDDDDLTANSIAPQDLQRIARQFVGAGPVEFLDKSCTAIAGELGDNLAGIFARYPRRISVFEDGEFGATVYWE